MKDKLLLFIGIGALVLAFVGPAIAGTVSGDGVTPWGPFNQMRSGHAGVGPGMMFGSSGYGSSQPDSTISGAAEVSVTLDDFAISPSPVVITAGQATNFTVTNPGAAPHDFTVPDLGIRIVVAPGETVTAGIDAQPAGTYETLCSVPGHASLGMVGTFVVENQ
ncbi:MAG: cupredoxin domain-containing protein [Actinomycetia bacterium]|nr:cupredoxin domain-containing protein [Actinomycetes bacterium]